jgi:hypothetical protein
MVSVNAERKKRALHAREVLRLQVMDSKGENDKRKGKGKGSDDNKLDLEDFDNEETATTTRRRTGWRERRSVPDREGKREWCDGCPTGFVLVPILVSAGRYRSTTTATRE